MNANIHPVQLKILSNILLTFFASFTATVARIVSDSIGNTYVLLYASLFF